MKHNPAMRYLHADRTSRRCSRAVARDSGPHPSDCDDSYTLTELVQNWLASDECPLDLNAIADEIVGRKLWHEDARDALIERIRPIVEHASTFKIGPDLFPRWLLNAALEHVNWHGIASIMLSEAKTRASAKAVRP